jgi:hypothetical protein
MWHVYTKAKTTSNGERKEIELVGSRLRAVPFVLDLDEEKITVPTHRKMSFSQE